MVLLAAGVLVGTVIGVGAAPAGADTDPTTLLGQGGSFLEPVMSKLLNDDAANLNPLFGAYLLTDDVSSVSAFAGSGQGQFAADFAVTQRPLTAAESTQATADGRTYAYIPFAATPVAIATLVPTYTWANSNSTTITPAGFCQGIPLTVAALGELYGYDAANPLQDWGDNTRITCPSGGGPGGSSSELHLPPVAYANLDPSISNDALMTLLDSDPTAKGYFDAALNGGIPGALTTSDTPSELWPFAGNTIPGGDQPLIGKLLDINSETNGPSTTANLWVLGATAPLSSVWTQAPLGVAWDLPTAAIQNAQGSFVSPTLAAAQAAQSDASLASTSDPTTNNLVTFNASTSDAAAYNSDLMEESYLVVPTTGLTAPKAAALAQVVRFILGTQGQKDIASFGSAPATPAMQAAGLKVATELNAEATGTSATAAIGSTTTGATTTTTAGSAASTGATGGTTTSSGSGGSNGSGGSSDSSGSGLAFTGSAHVGAWVLLGAAMIAAGSILRRRLKRREARS